MPGVRAVLDEHLARPLDEQMATQTATAAAKEHVLLTVMAGRGGPGDPESVQVGERIAERARLTYQPAAPEHQRDEHPILHWIRSALAA
jgi:hypothetical protein